MNIDAWPFLVGCNRTLGYQVIVLPNFLSSAVTSYHLLKVTGGHDSAPMSATAREIRGSEVGTITVIFRVVRAQAQEFDIEGSGVLEDKVGRPIRLFEGVVVQGGIEDVQRAVLTQKDLQMAHDQVKKAYQAFWQANERFYEQLSQSFTLQGSSDTADQITLKVETPLEVSSSLVTKRHNISDTGVSDNPRRSVQTHPKQPDRRSVLIAGFAAGLTALNAGVFTWWGIVSRSSTTAQVPPCAPSNGWIANKGLITPGALLWGADPLNGAPYVFADANGNLLGFEVDIANEIAQLMQVTQGCHQAPYTSLDEHLQSRKMDIILNGWEITQDHLKDDSFSAPYYCYSQQLVVRVKDTRFTHYTTTSQITLTELKNYTFGTGKGFKAVELLRGNGLKVSESDVPLNDLNNGSVDVVMIDTPIVAYYVLGRGKGAIPSQTLRPIGQPLFANLASVYQIGFKANDLNADTLRQEIEKALSVLKQNGTLKRIYQEWGLWQEQGLGNELQKKIGIVDCV